MSIFPHSKIRTLQAKMIFFIENIFHPEFHKTKEKILKHGFIRQKNAQSVDFRVSTRFSLHPQIVSDRFLFDFWSAFGA